MTTKEVLEDEDYERGPITENDYTMLPGYTEYARINREIYDGLNDRFIDHTIELVHENNWKSFLYPDPYVEGSFNPVVVPLLADMPGFHPDQSFIMKIGIPELIHKNSPEALVPVKYRINLETDGTLSNVIADFDYSGEYDPRIWAKNGIELVEAYWFCGERPGMT